MSDQAVNFSGKIKVVLKDERSVVVELSPLVNSFQYAVVTERTLGWEEVNDRDGTFEIGLAVHGTGELGGEAVIAHSIHRGEMAPAV